MKGYLLDTNVLIALFWPGHANHDVAMRWFGRHRAKGWATCLLTQAGFVRIVSNPSFTPDAVAPTEAIEVLATNTNSSDHTFWMEDKSIADGMESTGLRLIGHQQVTDACLLALAIRKGGRLATLDRKIASLTDPNSIGRNALELVS